MTSANNEPVLTIPEVMFSNPYHRYTAELLRSVGGGGLSLIDIGCGNGDMTVFAEALGHFVTPVDISDARLSQERKEAFNLIQTDINKPLPFVDESFDGAFMLEVIEHITGAEKLVGEISRILKPGGFIIITTPNQAYYKRRIKAFHGREPDDEGYHYRFFVKRKLLKLFRERGLEVSMSNSFGFLPLVDRLLLRKLLRKKKLRFKIPYVFESLLADRFVWLLRKKDVYRLSHMFL